MNISPTEAEEAIDAIQKMMQKTRHSIASSGVYIFLVITGIVWLVGSISTQFLTGNIVAYIWIGMSIVGSAVAILIGNRINKRLRGPSVNAPAKQAVIFWLLLILYAIAAVAIARPTDGKQVTMFVILFTMLGQSAMGMLLSFSATWWALPITILALVGYFLFPGFFYLWMGVLVGGAMIIIGLYIHYKW
jgi:hypothetical protein